MRTSSITGILLRATWKKNTYTCKQGDKNRTQSQCLVFFFLIFCLLPTLSSINHSVHIKIYIDFRTSKRTLGYPPSPTNKLACMWCQFIPQHAAMPKRVSQDILPFYCLTSFVDKTSRHTCCSPDAKLLFAAAIKNVQQEWPFVHQELHLCHLQPLL